MLDPANILAADKAVADVTAAVARLQAAVDGRWRVLTFITGSDSTAAAEDEDLRQSQNILDQLQRARPTLTNEGMAGFIALARAGGAVYAGVASATLTSPAGFEAEVVAPTLATIKSAASAVGVGVGGLVLVVLGVGAAIFALRWREAK